MEIVRSLAGFSLGGADMVRRAMSKKKAHEMEKARQNFIYGEVDEDGNILIPGCLRRGIDEKTASSIFDDMDAFAKYAFNKSHAASYAVVAYQTAYLKCFYPVYFMAALISGFMDETNKVLLYVEHCKDMGIKILPPDINKSYSSFSVENGNIRFGLGCVKNVGLSFMDKIVEERREGGKFKTFTDFAKRMSKRELNKRGVEGIIRVGAFDGIVENRSKLLAGYENIIESALREKRSNIEGQISLFGDIIETEDHIADDLPNAPTHPKSMYLEMEKEWGGMYFSGHPLDEYRSIVSDNRFARIARILSVNEAEGDSPQVGEDEYADGDNVVVAGIITSRRDKITKNNTLMSFVTIEDHTGSIEVIVFPKTLNKCDSILKENEVVRISARIDAREEATPKLIMDTVAPLEKEENVQTGIAKTLVITLKNGEAYRLDDLRKIILSKKGIDKVVLKLPDRDVECHSSVKTNADKTVDLINTFFGETRARVDK